MNVIDLNKTKMIDSNLVITKLDTQNKGFNDVYEIRFQIPKETHVLKPRFNEVKVSC